MAVRTRTKSTASLSARWITTSVMVHPPRGGLNDRAAGGRPRTCSSRRSGAVPYRASSAVRVCSMGTKGPEKGRPLLVGSQPPYLCSADGEYPDSPEQLPLRYVGGASDRCDRSDAGDSCGRRSVNHLVCMQQARPSATLFTA